MNDLYGVNLDIHHYWEIFRVNLINFTISISPFHAFLLS